MSRARALLWMVGAGALGLGLGCSRPDAGRASPTDPPRPSLRAGEAAVVEVAGDEPVQVVHAAPGERGALVYLHGRCADPGPDVKAVAPAASRHATLLAPLADEACQGGPNRRWTRDIDAIQQRIDRALEAVERARGGPLDRDRLTVVGYSEGAARAESLAARAPGRYARVVLIGAPEAPSAANLQSARAVALLAGELDRHDLMQTGQRSLEQAGKPARFFELPGAEHGKFGPEGDRVMGEALDWVFGAAVP